jgi:hypothetical protein
MNILGPNPQRGHGPVDWSALSQKRAEASEVTPLNLLGARIVDEDDATPATPANGGSSDLLIRGLVERLPAIDEAWPIAERAKWLRTAATIFALVYRTGEDEDGEIGVALTGAPKKLAEAPPAKAKEAAPAETTDPVPAKKKEEASPEKSSADFSVLGNSSS